LSQPVSKWGRVKKNNAAHDRAENAWYGDIALVALGTAHSSASHSYRIISLHVIRAVEPEPATHKPGSACTPAAQPALSYAYTFRSVVWSPAFAERMLDECALQ